MARVHLESSKYYLNREASWLAFNRRVLEEAQDESNPLLERLKFLAITSRNLDEFFEVRVGALLQRVEDGYSERTPDGLTPEQEAALISESTHAFVDDQYRCWNEQLRPTLSQQGIRVLAVGELSEEQREFVTQYCQTELDPLLTPVTVDPAHPFPRVLNKALCLALLLRRRRRSSGTYLGVVTVPRALPRIIRVPSGEAGTDDYVFLADLVSLHAAEMYQGYDILSEAAFRVTRNSNLYLQEEESRSLMESVRTELHNRRKGDAVRLEIEAHAGPEIVDRLRENFGLQEWQVFRVNGPVNFSRLFHMYDESQRPDLKYAPFAARELKLARRSRHIFDELREHDILLHHPFDSYDGVVRFIQEAAEDPRVLSIRQTLYRTSEESPIIESLVEAAASKEVTVVVELKARFDEAPNIRWARQLEDSGVQVYHGLVGLKTHCKICLMVRKDEDGVPRRYAHLGTGNYNPATAAQYTDVSLLTADEELTAASAAVFHYLTAYAESSSYAPLLVAPLTLADQTLALIDREAAHAAAGRDARIIVKLNSLVDRNVIEALYRASQAGVEIDLIVRGICALRPGIRGVSERIRVRSIVGRFLEHSRIFYFANAGEEEIYVGSADWMPRNLYERVEVLFPIKQPLLRQRIMDEILPAYLADRAKARMLRADGEYVRPSRPRMFTGRPAFNAQEFLISLAEGRAKPSDIPPAVAGKRRVRRVAKSTR
jgi:polyphosphate kinase